LIITLNDAKNISMAIISLDHVGKIYSGSAKVVNDFNLEIKDGEFVVLVGPSGCGKSTTLRMIAGLEEISEGTIRIGGRVVNDVPPKDRDIAMVFQNYALYPHMSVRENMAFGLKLRHFSKPEIESRVREAASILGLEAYLERRPKSLSGGQRQRVALGRSLVRKPAVFLFDEPLSNLDAKMRVQMRVEISRLHRKLGATMVYVTHDQVEAMTMGERIVVMKDGIIQQVDDPIRLYDQPVNRFVAGFIGTPPLNMFEGTLRVSEAGILFAGPGGMNLKLSGKAVTALAPYHNKPVTLGLRPEDIGSIAAEELPHPQRIKSFVDFIERMGSDSYVYGRVADTTFISRVDSRKRFQTDQPIEPAVFMDRAHFFDPSTEQRIPLEA